MTEISIDDVSKRFERHLAVKDNFRIIFSGKFGIGKTFFLKEYFKERKDNYNTFLLSPVNYVVSSNEDIFELIKADIIKDLFLTGKINLNKLPEDNTLQKISNYVEDKSAVIGNFMLKFISKLSTSTEIPKEVIDSISNIYKGYKKHSKEKKENEQTRSEELMEYWEDFEEKIGNIYEHNYVTKVINTFLEEIRTPKQNVLIIDDLDRIDPEHIFRILNILSVHNNYFDSENKFAFDHVILVCDIENIQKIFYHKYGAGVDFEGYIDKFYSTHIFDFTNNDAVVTYVKSVFETSVSQKSYLDFVTLILQNLVEQNLLSVRRLLKHNYDFSFEKFILHEQFGIIETSHYIERSRNFFSDSVKFYVDSDDFSLLNFFRLMTFVFGDFNSFYKNLIELKTTEKLISYKNFLDIISFLSLQNHIALKKGDDVFFTKYRENHSGSSSIQSVVYPKNKFLSKEFNFDLKWSQGNLYQGEESYFKDVKILDKQQQYDTPDTELKLSLLFESIEKMIISCDERGYLAQAGISFKKK
jgi:KAP family P-loop domain